MNVNRNAATLPIISESQRFSPWLALVIPAIASATTLFYPRKLLVTELIISAVTLVFLYSCNLRTELREDGLYYRFFPFHLRWHLIPKSEIATITTRKYSPLREYGGWGIRGVFPASAYNTQGTIGIQLELHNGRRVLFGTQKQAEWDRAIAEAF